MPSAPPCAPRRLTSRFFDRRGLANTILAMCRAEKSRLADHFQCVVNQRRLHQQQADRLDVPDYALDKHTQKGRKQGRGVDHWREHGCLLIPQRAIDDPYADEASTWWANDVIQTDWGKKRRSGKRKNDGFGQEDMPF